MKAAGRGAYGRAGSGFSNTSGQSVKVNVKGSTVTFSVDIDGHAYTFNGTIRGE
jgi:hypothetical protein